MKMQLLVFVVSSITIVLGAGEVDESQSPPPSYKVQPWHSYQANKARLPQTTQSYLNYNNYQGKRRYVSDACGTQEQCLAESVLYLGSPCSGSSYNFDACAVYVKNSQCTSGRCACQKDFVQLDVLGCLPLVNLNEECSISSQCHAPNSLCSNEGKCVCHTGFVLKGERRQLYCLPEKKPLDSCKYDEECTTEHSSCTNTVCQCDEGFVKVNDKCLPARHVGEACEVDAECVDASSECKNSVCACEPLTVSDSSRKNRLSKCLPVKKLGEKCLVDAQCQHMGEDKSCQNRLCECQQGLLNVANQLCLPSNVKIGEPCFISAQCSSPVGSYGRVGCYLESRSTQTLCLVEGEAFKNSYAYRYNQPSYTPQSSLYKHDYKKYTYSKGEEEEDTEDENNENDQAKLQQKNQPPKYLNKNKSQTSYDEEENEDYSSNNLQSKLTSGNQLTKTKYSNQNEKDDYSDDDSYLQEGKSSKGLPTSTARPSLKTQNSDEDDYEGEDSSTQYNTKMPFKTTTVSEDEDTTESQETDNISNYKQLMKPKSPSYQPWTYNQRKPVHYH